MSRKKCVPNYEEDIPKTLEGRPFFGLTLDADQKAFAEAILSDNNDIIFCNSAAGCGKTVVATSVAEMLHGYGRYSKIIYIMCPCSDRQGFLPGTIAEKSSVYFEAFYQSLEKIGVNIMTAINDESMINQKNGTGYITCITDTYLRGVSFEDAIIILDESQNRTLEELKKALTRVCDSTKVIVIGHDKQCDLKDKSSSGFTRYIEHFRGTERCAVCNLTINHRGWVSQWADECEG